jgi:outer membrane protein assembly factor BamE
VFKHPVFRYDAAGSKGDPMSFQMQKLLIPVTAVASLLLAGCAGDPVASRLPWVYRIEVQQGNVFTQEEVNQLRTGMSKRQVLYILGYPMITDPFHADRWDYYYHYDPGSDGASEAGQEVLTLRFRDDELVNISGSLQPQPGAGSDRPAGHVSVVVPPQEREDPGILTRMWRWIGFGRNG